MSANRLAIDGGKLVDERPFPDWPVFDDPEVETVAAVVRSDKSGGQPVRLWRLACPTAPPRSPQ